MTASERGQLPGRFTNGQLTVGGLLEDRALRGPDDVFFTCGGQTFTYAGCDQEANRLANALRELKVRSGDVVILMLPNCAEMLLLSFGLAKIGAIAAPIDPRYKSHSLARMITTLDSSVVICSAEAWLEMQQAVREVKSVRACILAGCVDDSLLAQERSGADAFRVLSYEGLTCEDLTPPGEDVDPNAPLTCIFTSGSTGPAKAVALSHAFALHCATEVIEHAGYRQSDIMYTPYPLFHSDALCNSVLVALVLGTKVAVASRFSARAFLNEVRREGATVFTAMGAVISILCSQERESDDSDNPLRLAIGGALPECASEFEERFDLRLMEVYGATECGLVAFNTRTRHRRGECGFVCEHNEVRIVDDDDEELPVGTPGQIVVRPRDNYGIMNGYYGDPEATRVAWRNLMYHTGDLGYVDADGMLHFISRIKDVIRRRGEMISAFEVEEVFNAHPSVMQAAAVAVPAAIGDDEIKVVVVLRAEAAEAPDGLMEFVRSRLPAHMIPRYLELVDELPLTVSSKVDKPALRASGVSATTVDLGG